MNARNFDVNGVRMARASSNPTFTKDKVTSDNNCTDRNSTDYRETNQAFVIGGESYSRSLPSIMYRAAASRLRLRSLKVCSFPTTPFDSHLSFPTLPKFAACLSISFITYLSFFFLKKF